MSLFPQEIDAPCIGVSKSSIRSNCGNLAALFCLIQRRTCTQLVPSNAEISCSG